MLKNKSILLIGGVALAVMGLFFWLSSLDSKEGKNNDQVACLTSEIFHIHPELKVFVNGQPEIIPANLGIKPGCTRELHTHDTDGIIHVESAVDRGYKFSDFLRVWDRPVEREDYVLKMTVDGVETTDSNFVLKDKQQIVLEYLRKPIMN